MLPRAEQRAGPTHKSLLSTCRAAHKSSHAPKKSLQTEAAGHQPCNKSLLQNHFLLLKQSQWPAWSVKQMGRIQQEAQGTVFCGCLVFVSLWVLVFFFLQQRQGLRLTEARTGFGGRVENRNNRSFHLWPRPGFTFPREQKLWMQETKIIKKTHFDGSSGPTHGPDFALRRNRKVERQICSRQPW